MREGVRGEGEVRSWVYGWGERWVGLLGRWKGKKYRRWVLEMGQRLRRIER